MGFFSKTTTWKNETGQKSINFCMPHGLLHELDSLKQATGGTRSEMIRTAIRLYIKEKKNQLATQERLDLETYHIKCQNRKRQVITGLLPDY